jgi:tripartite-type tricarboxylate transporter receptor subunit TctC
MRIHGSPYCRKARADASQISITPLLSKTAYDPVKDFVPISVIGTKAWAVSGTLPIATFAEFVDYARERPDQLAYADAGVGSIPHLSTALVFGRMGLRMIRVSYKGSGVSTTDLVAGRIAVSFTNLPTVLPYLSDHTLKVLAVAGERRSPQLPTVPTFCRGRPSGYCFLHLARPHGASGYAAHDRRSDCRRGGARREGSRDCKAPYQ